MTKLWIDLMQISQNKDNYHHYLTASSKTVDPFKCSIIVKEVAIGLVDVVVLFKY